MEVTDEPPLLNRCSMMGTRPTLRLIGYLWVAAMFGVLAVLEADRIGVCLVPPFGATLTVLALSRTSLRPRPRSQRSSASIASSYHDQCARARNIFILPCGTKDHVLLVPQSRQRINSGRSPCRRIASENRGA